MNFSHILLANFTLKIFGFFVALAFLGGVWLYYKSLQQKNFNVDFFVHHFWGWLLGGIIVGRLSALALNPDIIMRNGILSFFTFWDGNIYFLGAFVGFFGTMYLDIKKHKQNFFRWTDLGVAPFLSAVLVTDLARFITGFGYGLPTTLPWGIQYETFGVELLTPLHPIGIYAFIIHFWLLRWIQKREKPFEKFHGKLTFHAGMFFFGIESLLQILRGDPVTMIGAVRLDLIVNLLFLVAFIYLWYQRFHRAK